MVIAVHYISLENSQNLSIEYLKVVNIFDFVNKPFCPDVHNIYLNNEKLLDPCEEGGTKFYTWGYEYLSVNVCKH